MKTKNWLLILVLLCIHFQCHADDREKSDIQIDSKHLNEIRNISITLPLHYSTSKQQYPVLYVLDDHMEKPSAYVTNFLMEKKHIPDLILVNIDNTGHRSRDYQTFHRDSEQRNPGADKFLNFLQSELIPYVEKNVRTNGYRMLAGHSMAGNFVLHSLIHSPELFRARFAFSPSAHHIPMQRELIKDLLSGAESLNSFLYVNVGEDEWYKIKEAFEDLSAIAKTAPQGLRSQFERLSNEGHQTTPFIGLHRALKGLYAPSRLGNSYANMRFSQVEKHFENLSNEYGYQVTPQLKELNSMQYFYAVMLPQSNTLNTINLLLRKYYANEPGVAGNSAFFEQWLTTANTQPMRFATGSIPDEGNIVNLGYRYYANQHSDKAVFLFQLATELYPDSANAWDSLGEGLEQVGALDKALPLYQKAYKLAVDNQYDAADIEVYKQHAERAQKAMDNR